MPELSEATLEHAAFLSTRLRQADVDEAWAAAMLDPYAALAMGLGSSTLALTAHLDGEPGAMFGVCRLGPAEGQLWMLAGEVFGRRPRPFLRATRS